jgi:hypothetical protein
VFIIDVDSLRPSQLQFGKIYVGREMFLDCICIYFDGTGGRGRVGGGPGQGGRFCGAMVDSSKKAAIEDV